MNIDDVVASERILWTVRQDRSGWFRPMPEEAAVTFGETDVERDLLYSEACSIADSLNTIADIQET